MNEPHHTQDALSSPAPADENPIASPAIVKPRVVLDTNVILALWWFADPQLGALRHLVENDQLTWLLGTDGEAELRFVIQQQLPATDTERATRSAQVWHHMEARAQRCAPANPPSTLRCTDADDQKFIDLALAERCSWLFSRDKAVLRLSRRAKPLGLTIVNPDLWVKTQPRRDHGDADARP